MPGYDVRASGLGDEERDRNLDTLRYIGDQATRRGLHFQLGLWTHAYQWTDSPDANYTISGLDPATHAAYCRDALTALLQACPGIHGPHAPHARRERRAGGRRRALRTSGGRS